MADLPRVIADGPLAAAVTTRLDGQVELLPWSHTEQTDASIRGLYTYGHPRVDGELLDRFPALQIVSNYGVGVDHIDLVAAAQRSVPVGNTPGVLDGATADMAFALLMASARRVVEGDHYARSPQFTSYDPGYMLGREVHGAVLGIIGLGRIGWQIARRARGFDMQVLYHNRRRRDDAEEQLNAIYTSKQDLLRGADYVVLSCPLSEETRGLIGGDELRAMKPTATLINIGRGPLVDTAALTQALTDRVIRAAGLDVTDPEPLPRDHPLLKLDNLTIAPHLGSATEQTRERMAEISVLNLLAGLGDEQLPHQVTG